MHVGDTYIDAESRKMHIFPPHVSLIAAHASAYKLNIDHHAIIVKSDG
jgi:hypothetical protein